MSGQDKKIRAEAPDYTPLARVLLPKIREAAENPEMMRRFEEWKKERETQNRRA